MSDSKMAWVYMVECADGTLYTGWTYDVVTRIDCHNRGIGAKYTRTRRPVKLVYREQQLDKIAAMQREYHLKTLTRLQKLKLIAAAL